MLGLIILFFVCSGFYKAAENRGRRGWLWVIFALLTYFGTQFIIGGIFGIFYGSEYEKNVGTVLAVAILASILALIGLYLILKFKINESASDNFTLDTGINNSSEYKEGNSRNPFITPDK